MKDAECVEFLQWALPRLRMRWPGFRKVRRQVCRRIDGRRLQLGLDSVPQYRDYLEDHADEWQVLDTFCRITISRFYRDRGVFDFLRAKVFPRVALLAQTRKNKVVRCWCAGSASGEEVYTVNIMWQRDVQPRYPDVQFQLVATDADPAMLARAQQAIYGASSLKDCPIKWMEEVFTADHGECRLADCYRDKIDWQVQDLRQEMPAGPYHLIFCRHLAFTYFAEPLQSSILDSLIKRLAPGGFLITGKQEALPAGRPELEPYGQHMGIYCLHDEAQKNLTLSAASRSDAENTANTTTSVDR